MEVVLCSLSACADYALKLIFNYQILSFHWIHLLSFVQQKQFFATDKFLAKQAEISYKGVGNTDPPAPQLQAPPGTSAEQQDSSSWASV